jgi:hypothetical protein
MLTITVMQVGRSEQIEGVIATHVVEDADIQIRLGEVLREQQAISKSNGMRLWWEDWEQVRINEEDGIGFTYWGFETDHDGSEEDGGPLVVAVDVRRPH